jgi:predicted aconitase with swiveling domain
MERTLIGRAIVAGSAAGTALVSKEPLSFWGGVCPRTGEVIDRRHELSGASVTGKVFVLPTGRGSSTSSATLMQSIKAGVAPAAIINLSVDPILALGSIVSDELYHQTVPIVILGQEDFSSIKQNDYLVVKPDGKVLVNAKRGK